MKILFRYKYPKITALFLISILVYILFTNERFVFILNGSESLNYLEALIAGTLFSFGFTTPFAIGYFLTTNSSNILLASLIGGFGAMISDLLIFHVIRFSFMDEFNRIKRTNSFNIIKNTAKTNLSKKIYNYILYSIAGIIIASPLPDELGVSMLAGLSQIKSSKLAIISFIMNTIGIAIILFINVSI